MNGTCEVLRPKVATSSDEKEAGINGVHIGPGATAFTRIPWSTNDNAKDLVRDTIAPFVEL